MIKPYDNEYMTFNENTHRYVLTERGVFLNFNEDLSAKVKDNKDIKPMLDIISRQVYRFIHQFSNDNEYQDYIIAHTEDGRKIIQSAMEEQFLYFLTVGDLSRDVDINKRALWFDDNAKEELFKPIREIGCSICYNGISGRIAKLEW